MPPKKAHTNNYHKMTSEEFQYGDYGLNYQPGAYDQEIIQAQQRYEIPERQKLSKTYHVKFSLKYNVPEGHKLYCMGSIPEISEWNKENPLVQLKQKFQGSNVWQLDKDIVTNKFFFVYKFAIYD